MFFKLMGGRDIPIDTLLIFILCDYFTGFCLACIFKKSPKTESGGLSSPEGYKGIIKKILILLIVAVAVRLDLFLGTAFIRNATISAFCANEVISITENVGLMLGYNVPSVIRNAIDILIKKGEQQ